MTDCLWERLEEVVVELLWRQDFDYWRVLVQLNCHAQTPRLCEVSL